MSSSKFVFLAGMLLSAGCSTAPQMASLCPEPANVSPQYVIGVGDSLNIFVWRNPEVSTIVDVRPDGQISTPLVEDMVASGKTPSQLARDLEEVLAEYLRSPSVNVMVESPGQSNAIQVVGEVNNPSVVPYHESIQVLEAVIAAGGLVEFAAGNRARIARQVEGGLYECSVRLNDLLAGDLTQNIRMFPGDILVVPASVF